MSKETFGGEVDGDRLERAKHSPHWHDGRFVNQVATETMSEGSFWRVMTDYLGEADHRRPSEPVEVKPLVGAALEESEELQAVWLGHSTVLLKIDRTILLTDPLFDDEVGVSSGIQSMPRFFPCPARREELPSVEAVLISHDHFDHLEESTVRFFAGTATKYIVPLGVGAHLEAWGLPDSQIVELDWGDSARVGQLTVHCTPARHFSGRSPLHLNETLWSSWVIAGRSTRVFYSGDTGPGEHFGEIGRTYGPFDLTLLQIGAYGDNWPEIHLTPEEAVAAQLALGGTMLLPVHWGTFDLALHSWNDPVTRLMAAARESGAAIVTPRPGEIVVPANHLSNSTWWQIDQEGVVDGPK